MREAELSRMESKLQAVPTHWAVTDGDWHVLVRCEPVNDRQTGELY